MSALVREKMYLCIVQPDQHFRCAITRLGFAYGAPVIIGKALTLLILPRQNSPCW